MEEINDYFQQQRSTQEDPQFDAIGTGTSAIQILFQHADLRWVPTKHHVLSSHVALMF